MSEPPGGRSALVAAIFFVVFVLIGGFMLIKLFAGVVIDKFNRLREEQRCADPCTDPMLRPLLLPRLVAAGYCC